MTSEWEQSPVTNPGSPIRMLEKGKWKSGYLHTIQDYTNDHPVKFITTQGGTNPLMHKTIEIKFK